MFHQNHHWHVRDFARHLRPSWTHHRAVAVPSEPSSSGAFVATSASMPLKPLTAAAHDDHNHDHDHDHDHERHGIEGAHNDAVHGGGTASLLQTTFNVLTSYIGVGVYALPYAFKQTGLWAGILLMLLTAVTSAYVNQLLVSARTHVQVHAPIGVVVDYPELGKEAFGRKGAVTVAVVIVIAQIGGCSAYLIFMATTLHMLAPSLTVQEYVGVLMFIVMFLCMLHDLKYLSHVSMFANLVFLTAVVSLFVYGFRFSWSPAPRQDFIRPSLFIGVGSILFTMAAANLAIPIESSMREPRHYKLLNQVGVAVVTLLFLLVGIFGFLFYGDATLPMVINNLPADDRYVSAVKVLLVVQIIFTYPLQIFPVIQLVEEAVIHPDSNPYWHESKRVAVRVALVGVTALVATLLPYFSLVSALMGALASSLSGFIFPALIYTRLFWGAIARWRVAVNAAIVVIGLAVGIVSSYFVLASIVACVQGTAAAGTC